VEQLQARGGKFVPRNFFSEKVVKALSLTSKKFAVHSSYPLTQLLDSIKSCLINYSEYNVIYLAIRSRPSSMKLTCEAQMEPTAANVEENVSLAAPPDREQARIALQGEQSLPSDLEIDAYLKLFTNIIHRIIQEEAEGEVI
jgi:hypothetical protein